jgi:hypothetical protein
MHAECVLIKLKGDKELCSVENIKTDHKEVGCAEVSWTDLADCCNKWRILLNVTMDLQAA